MTVILGTAQDAGIPQLGCNCTNCQRALKDQRYSQMVSSLGIVNRTKGICYFIDCTPDFTKQLVLLNKHLINRQSVKNLRPGKTTSSYQPPAGIFLSHAHIGHYLGIVQLGKEAAACSKIPVYATARMGNFLTANQPFKSLIDEQHIELHRLSHDREYIINNELSITPFDVPHRNELSDTVGFIIKGRNKKVLYAPDMNELTQSILDQISMVDIAIIDGTFYDASELTSRRAVSKVQHPIIKDSSQDLFKYLKDTDIYFTHFNHTNPVLIPNSAAQKSVKTLGFKLARTGQRFLI